MPLQWRNQFWQVWRKVPESDARSASRDIRVSMAQFPGTLAVLFITGGSCHKYHFCRTCLCLSTNSCRDRSFSATKIFCRDKQILILLRQAYFCCEKIRVCRDKIVLVAASAKDTLAAVPVSACTGRSSWPFRVSACTGRSSWPFRCRLN